MHEDARAERAILSSAEAYRLVEEARQMREERDRWEAVAADLTERLGAASRCADLLVRIVRPWYSGPSGDQGLNDPLYGECLSAIRQYKRA